MSVPVHGVRDRQPSTKGREFAVVLGPHDKVPVISHQDERKEMHGELVECFGQDSQECFVISSLLEERQACHGPIEDVVDDTAKSLSRTPRHGGMVT